MGQWRGDPVGPPWLAGFGSGCNLLEKAAQVSVEIGRPLKLIEMSDFVQDLDLGVGDMVGQELIDLNRGGLVFPAGVDLGGLADGLELLRDVPVEDPVGALAEAKKTCLGKLSSTMNLALMRSSTSGRSRLVRAATAPSIRPLNAPVRSSWNA